MTVFSLHGSSWPDYTTLLPFHGAHICIQLLLHLQLPQRGFECACRLAAYCLSELWSSAPTACGPNSTLLVVDTAHKAGQAVPDGSLSHNSKRERESWLAFCM
jgi:hypothetical protein